MFRSAQESSGAGSRSSNPSVGSKPATICLLARGADSADPIDEHALRSAQALTAAGHRVHLLWCRWSGTGSGAAAFVAGAACAMDSDPLFSEHRLVDFPCSSTLTLDGPNLTPALHDSDRVYHALKRLHEAACLDLIVFPDRGGLGFRSIQAKQTGQAFADVCLGVTLHGTNFGWTQQRQQWLSDWRDAVLDHAERYGADFADVRFAADSEAFTESPPATADANVAATRTPLVTICVPYYNLGDYLEETLAALARQTYPHLEVIVINDGSTQPHAIEVFQRMPNMFPQFRFLEQPNAGIGATRNRGLAEARGAYFLPVDADNIARADMVERFVAGLERNPAIAALTCYFLAFRESVDVGAGRFAYAFKPTGGPRVLGCLQNVYGDANAMFRTDALRAIGGFATDRDTSFEDWEAFVQLVNCGRRVDVLPDFLFHYRHRDAGFSRTTNGFRNHQRVLRRFVEIDALPECERRLLWNWLVGSQQRLTELEAANRALRGGRHRLVDGVKRALRRLLGATSTPNSAS